MTTVENVIKTARAEVGYHEGRSGGHWNNKEKYAAQVPGLAWVSAGGYPWCALFVSWAFNKVGALGLIPGGATASVAHLRDAAKQAHRYSEYPAVGAIVIFGNADHTGIVVAYDATTITTVEGNTNTSGSAEGDGVYEKTHRRTDAWVTGYVYPTYPEGIESADPAWLHARPVVTPARRPGPNIVTALNAATRAKDWAAKHNQPGRVSALSKALDWLRKGK